MISNYRIAKEKYKKIGVDTESALELLGCILISIHCWQLDDCAGFENQDSSLSGGGILSTGDYPGKARNLSELLSDLEIVLTLMPGDIERELRYLKSKNILTLVAIDPDVNINCLDQYLKIIDNIIVMSAYLGFGSQKFIKKCLKKVSRLKKIITNHNLNISISVDGGVNRNNEIEIIEKGADILIYGSSLFK